MDSDAITIFLKVFDENRAVSDMTLKNQNQNKKVNLGLFVRLIFVFPATLFLLCFQPFFDP